MKTTLQPLTEEVLNVFWTVEEKSADGSLRKYQEEVDGLLIYGYWNQRPSNKLSFPLHVWPDGTLAKKYLYEDSGWTIVEWTIRILAWPIPSAWCDILEKSMNALCQQGALVSWCGTEGFFNAPTDLFVPESTGDSIYAAYSPQHGMACSAYLHERYKGLTAETLLKMKDIIK